MMLHVSSEPSSSTSAAFAPFPRLPRRKSSTALPLPNRARPMFNFGKPEDSSDSESDQDDDDDDDAEEEAPAPSVISTQVTTPSPPASRPLSLSLDATGIPFPSVSPVRSGPPSPSVLPRTPSTPIILSNGKPLKPSLKSSLSAPHLPPAAALHLRSQSAPSSPNLPKNVHFPERGEDLQSVRLFRPAGRPTAVSLQGADETETETEGYDSANPLNSAGANGYPFPHTPAQDTSVLVLHSGLTSPVPTPAPSAYANVHLETLQLPRSRPYTLCGSVLVRNVAFSKQVVVRFTLDDWQTTSEVAAHYVSSMPSLPPPLGRAPHGHSPLVGDALTALSHASVGWDRFAFQVRLEDVERRLAERTMWLVVRYTAAGVGEWWDNNAGANYRVVFRKETPPASQSQTAQKEDGVKALASQIKSSSAAGGRDMPPLQLRTKRPGLNTGLSFGAAPRPVANATATSTTPMSPVRGLSLRNYVPPKSPTTSRTPSPPASPTRPLLGLKLNPTPSPSPSPPPQPESTPAQQSSVAFPSLGSPTSTAPSVNGNSSYEALVRQWCFSGSPPPPPAHAGVRTRPEWFGAEAARGMVGVGEMA